MPPRLFPVDCAVTSIAGLRKLRCREAAACLSPTARAWGARAWGASALRKVLGLLYSHLSIAEPETLQKPVASADPRVTARVSPTVGGIESERTRGSPTPSCAVASARMHCLSSFELFAWTGG